MNLDGYTITPIRTQYGGHRFRSKLEAMWGVYLDYLEVEYKYEAFHYSLSNGMGYLPDFYLPAQDVFLEIKPCRTLTPHEVSKARAFVLDESIKPTLVICHGRPQLHAANYLLYDGYKFYPVRWTWEGGKAQLSHAAAAIGDPYHPILYRAVERSLNHEYVTLDNMDESE